MDACEEYYFVGCFLSLVLILNAAPISGVLDPREKTLGFFNFFYEKAYYIGFEPVKNFCVFLSKKLNFKVSQLYFRDAVEFCELRRMSLVALEEDNEYKMIKNSNFPPHSSSCKYSIWALMGREEVANMDKLGSKLYEVYIKERA